MRHVELFDNKPLSDEEMNIVTLAKAKLDDKMLSNLRFDQSVRERFNTSLTDSEQSLVKKVNHRKRQLAQKARQKTPDVQTLGDLDGWATANKLNDDSDNIQFSTSEILHPAGFVHTIPSGEFEGTYESLEVNSSKTMLAIKNVPSEHKDKIVTENFTEVLPESMSSETHCTFITENADSFTQEPETPTTFRTTSINQTNSQHILTDTSKTSPEPSGLSTDGFKKATKAVKLRLTKARFRNGAEENKDKRSEMPYTNVPLSHCVSYNIERNVKTCSQTTSKINMTDRLAVHLKNLSQGIPEQLHTTPRNETVSVGQRKSRHVVCAQSQKPVYQDIPVILSGTPVVMTQSTPKHNKKSEKCRLPDIEASKKTVASSNSKKLIPRQTEDNCANDLPKVSINSLTSRFKAPDKTRSKHHSNKVSCGRQGSIACRTPVCNSPYIFDREDPETLRVNAKPLPHLHEVCTGCGCIYNKSDIDDLGTDRKTIPKSHIGCSSKKTTRQCCKPECEENYSNVESMPGNCDNNNYDSAADTEPSSSNMLTFEVPFNASKTCKEMNVKLLDQDIKVKFQCEVSLQRCSPGADTNRIQSLCQRDIESRGERQHFETSVANQLCSYRSGQGKFLRSSLAVLDMSSGATDVPMSSPCLEYCRQRALEGSSMLFDLASQTNSNLNDYTVPLWNVQRSQQIKRKCTFMANLSFLKQNLCSPRRTK